MKRIFLILILSFFTLAFQGDNSFKIIGTISIPETHKDFLAGLIIELKSDSLVVAKTTLLSTNKFILTADKSKDYDLYYRGIGVIETYLATVKAISLDTINLDLSIPRKYKKRFGKAICPKCNKSDETVKIQYGLQTAIVVQHIDKSGDTTYVPYDNKRYYDGGCVTSDISPRWYCKRDRIKF